MQCSIYFTLINWLLNPNEWITTTYDVIIIIIIIISSSSSSSSITSLCNNLTRSIRSLSEKNYLFACSNWDIFFRDSLLFTTNKGLLKNQQKHGGHFLINNNEYGSQREARYLHTKTLTPQLGIKLVGLYIHAEIHMSETLSGR